MRWAPALLLGCVGLAACSFKVLGTTEGNADLAFPASDLAGVDSAHALPDIAGSGCDSCPDACDTTTTPPRCTHLQPTGPVVVGDLTQDGLTAHTISADIVVDTDTGAITGGLTRAMGSGVIGGVGFRVAMQNGPSVGVFSVAGLTVANTATITFTGSNAFALASSGPLTLNGTINASCSGPNNPGPGGYAGATATTAAGGPAGGANGAGAPVNAASGGGGGGFGDSGGKGAQGTGLTTTAAGGIYGDLTIPTFVLIGGSGGGLGGGTMSMSNGGLGGPGGGAVQLSVDGTVSINGVITVGGCGGSGATGGAGGGGAGGAIVIEGARVALATGSVLAANGGGGGGATVVNKNGDGATGSASTARAAGGMGMALGGSGGVGGASAGHPGLHFTQGGDGVALTGPQAIGGGGGGGCGRIAIRARANAIDDQSSAVTPDLTDTNNAGTHETSYGAATFQ